LFQRNPLRPPARGDALGRDLGLANRTEYPLAVLVSALSGDRHGFQSPVVIEFVDEDASEFSASEYLADVDEHVAVSQPVPMPCVEDGRLVHALGPEQLGFLLGGRCDELAEQYHQHDQAGAR